MKIYDLLRYGAVELQGALWAPCFILSSEPRLIFISIPRESWWNGPSGIPNLAEVQGGFLFTCGFVRCRDIA
jgi:hypothetical protein